MFEKMPPEEKERLICSVIPVRFQSARIEHLHESIRAKLMSTKEGAYLWGSAGVGKTYALSAIGRHFLSEGFLVQRINYEMLMLKLRDTFKPQSRNGELDVILPFIEADRLIIEDIGTTVSAGVQESDFSLRTLLVLLNERLEKMLPTYITSNKPVSELGKSFDSRIASRLSMFEIIQLKGDDKRKAAK